MKTAEGRKRHMKRSKNWTQFEDKEMYAHAQLFQSYTHHKNNWIIMNKNGYLPPYLTNEDINENMRKLKSDSSQNDYITDAEQMHFLHAFEAESIRPLEPQNEL